MIIHGHKQALKPSSAGLLLPMHVLEGIWEELSMDFITGLPNSHGKNIVLVIVDKLSKCAHFMH